MYHQKSVSRREARKIFSMVTPEIAFTVVSFKFMAHRKIFLCAILIKAHGVMTHITHENRLVIIHITMSNCAYRMHVRHIFVLGLFFVTEKDLKTTSKFKMDSSGRSILTILRHCNRLKEVRSKGLVRYAASA